MDYYNELPKILIAALAAGFLAQFLKALMISWKKKKSFRFKYVTFYGGMPSAHAAFLAALSTGVLIQEGLASASFAICIILSIIIIRDAFGFRMLLENQGMALKKMIKNNHEQYKDIENDSRFKTIGYRVGHTIPEITVGGIFGILVTLAVFYIL